jgi:hypothetical protein
MANPAQDPAEAVEPQQKRSSPHKPSGPENKEGAAKATADNDLTTGHSREGDGGDDNSKQKK